MAQRCPNPPMKNLVTMGAQHQGVFGIPNCPGESVALCNIMRELLYIGAYVDFVQSSLVQAQVKNKITKNKFSLHIFFQYWHDPIHADQYVEKSQFIAEINNEREVKNLTYAENLVKLENFVMVKFADVSLKKFRENKIRHQLAFFSFFRT